MQNNNMELDELRGEIWSQSLKYLDYMAHQTKTGEEYYIYRDEKGRELATDIMLLVAAHITEARIEELASIPLNPNGLPEYIKDRITALRASSEGKQDTITYTHELKDDLGNVMQTQDLTYPKKNEPME